MITIMVDIGEKRPPQMKRKKKEICFKICDKWKITKTKTMHKNKPVHLMSMCVSVCAVRFYFCLDTSLYATKQISLKFFWWLYSGIYSRHWFTIYFWAQEIDCPITWQRTPWLESIGEYLVDNSQSDFNNVC